MKHVSVEVENYSVDVVRKGVGQPLLLVHGSVSDARTWQAHIDILSRSFDVIAPSLRYFGLKPWPDSGQGFGTALHAADLLGVIDSLNLADVVCAGWSYGGNVAVHAGLLKPDVFKQLFLYEPALGSLITDEMQAQLAIEDRVEMFARTAENLNNMESSAMLEVFLDDIVDQKGVYQLLPEHIQHVCVENAPMLNLLFNMTPPKLSLETFSIPTLIACGEKSRSFYQITAKELEKQSAAISLNWISNGNHLWPLLDVDGFCKLLFELEHQNH